MKRSKNLNLRGKYLLVSLITGGFLSSVLTGGLAQASDAHMIEDIQVAETDGQSEIVIHLVEPAQVVKSGAGQVGDRLQIQLALPGNAGPGRSLPGAHEIVAWQPTPSVPMTNVAYDQIGSSSGRITLDFRKDMGFRVAAGEDARTLVVTATDPEQFQSAETERNSSSAPESGTKSKLDGKVEKSDIEQARDAVIKEDWSGAIAYYGKVLQRPESADLHQEAHEMQGLARERLGQNFRAKQEYEAYLKQYPKGEGADRVRQRLAALESAGNRAKAKLGRDKQGVGNERGTTPISAISGGISQYYYQGGDFSDTKGVTRDTSLLLNNFYVNGRYRNDRFDVRGKFDGRYRENFIEEQNRQFRISNMYVDFQDRLSGIMTRFGRQTRSTGGVLGRFDGGVFGYRFSPKWQAVAVGGMPVQPFRSTSVDTSNWFYGLSLEVGPFDDLWAGNVFFIDQFTKGLSVPDRRAVGGELRYQHSIHPVYSQVDYDVFVNELNIAQVQGSWNFEGGAIIQANFDYRRVPIASTSGTWDLLRYGTPGSVNEMLFQQVLNDAVLQRLARLNSSVMKTFTLGGIFPISQKYQFNADIMASDLSGSNDFAKYIQDVIYPQFGPFISQSTLGYWYPGYFSGVGVQSSGLQMSYTAQLIGNSLLAEGDVWTLGSRYVDNNGLQNIYSLFLDSSYPVTQSVRLSPRMRLDYFDGGRGQQALDSLRIRPAMRMNYRVMKALNVELEGGFEWLNNLEREELDRKSYYFTVGYRLDFN